MATLSAEPCAVCRGKPCLLKLLPNSHHNVKHRCTDLEALTSCTEKHVRCDRERPRCRRCQTRKLDCHWPAKKTIFRSGPSTNLNITFPDRQPWLGTNTARLEFVDVDKTVNAQITRSHDRYDEIPPSLSSSCVLDGNSASPVRPDNFVFAAQDRTPVFDESSPSISSTTTGTRQESGRPSVPSGRSQSRLASTPGPISLALPHDATCPKPVLEPLDVQKACLLRHFVDVIAHWFDLCDEARYFQLVVPLRARSSPPLLAAICAVSSRHLVRHPGYRTPQGIMYQNVLLPHLTSSSAVEYMLNCIPHLFEFHNCQDDNQRADLIAAAVVLRQYEELDDEVEPAPETQTENNDLETNQHATFLAITQAIIESSASSSSLAGKTLEHAAFWGAATQEIYNAVTRRRPFQMKFAPDVAEHASAANKLIMHTACVTKWCWGGKSEVGWQRLKAEQQSLELEYSHGFSPLFEQGPDHAKNEVLPTIWYTSPAQVTAMQHLDLAKMILIAEDPKVTNHSANVRGAQRKAEAQVRELVKHVCGIALSNPGCQPALVPAVMAISLYGGFFTDNKERTALLDVLSRTERQYAWPTKEILPLCYDWIVPSNKYNSCMNQRPAQLRLVLGILRQSGQL